MAKYFFAGATDLGYGRKINEDYIEVVQITPLRNDVVFAVVADGVGSRPSELQPASIVCADICNAVRDMFENNEDFFLDNAEPILRMLVLNSNRVLGAFKKANEEMYSGFGSTLTCCLLDKNYRFTLVHTGNSRLYLIRNRNNVSDIRQLTIDHTVGRELVDIGKITPEQYYTHPERNTLTSALGFISEPEIQTLSAPVKMGDIILMTTDGIHCAIRPEAMLEIVVKSDKCKKATESIIEAAKMQKYNDNMSAVTIFVQ